jgi:hypothetical protein
MPLHSLSLGLGGGKFFLLLIYQLQRLSLRTWPACLQQSSNQLRKSSSCDNILMNLKLSDRGSDSELETGSSCSRRHGTGSPWLRNPRRYQFTKPAARADQAAFAHTVKAAPPSQALRRGLIYRAVPIFVHPPVT